MKVIDCSPTPKKANSMSQLQGRLASSLKLSFLMNSETQAQDNLAARLGKMLPNKYFLLRNVKLEDLEVAIPMILLGPSGFTIIYPNAVKGIFRAQNDQWYMMGKSKKYEPSRPNLIQRSQLFAKTVETFLTKQGCTFPEIQPLLVFVNPGTHVDTVRPAVRILLMDGVDRFCTGLLQSSPTLTRDEIQNMVSKITAPPPPPAVDQESALRAELARSKAAQVLKSPAVQKFEAFARTVHMSTRQIIILGGLALTVVLILLALIFVVVLTA